MTGKGVHKCSFLSLLLIQQFLSCNYRCPLLLNMAGMLARNTCVSILMSKIKTDYLQPGSFERGNSAYCAHHLRGQHICQTCISKSTTRNCKFWALSHATNRIDSYVGTMSFICLKASEPPVSSSIWSNSATRSATQRRLSWLSAIVLLILFSQERKSLTIGKTCKNPSSELRCTWCHLQHYERLHACT